MSHVSQTTTDGRIMDAPQIGSLTKLFKCVLLVESQHGETWLKPMRTVKVLIRLADSQSDQQKYTRHFGINDVTNYKMAAYVTGHGPTSLPYFDVVDLKGYHRLSVNISRFLQYNPP